MYQPPYTVEEIKKHHPDIADGLLKDPVHLWRAETGIELIHKEPDLGEQLRIWDNWQQMSEEMKEISDTRSLELFGLNNRKHHEQIIASLK